MTKVGWWLAGIVLLGLGVRLWDLGGPSLWNDELFSRYYPRMGLGFLWGEGFRLEPNPPVYYTLLAGWMRVFGEGAGAMRGLGVAASVAGIPLGYLLARRWFGGARAGLLGAACLALSPTNVFYAQEARSYVFEGLGVTLALLGMTVFLQERRWGGLAAYAAGGMLAVYSHVTAALVLVAANLVMAGVLAVRRPGWGVGVRWGVVNLGMAALCLPLVPVALSPDVASAIGWMEAPTVMDAVSTLADVMVGLGVPNLSDTVAEAMLAVLLLVLAAWVRGRLAWAVGVGVPAVFFLLLGVASLRQPMLMLRTAAWMAVPGAVLLGGALARRRGMGAAVGLAVVAAALGVQLSMVRALKEDWRGFLGGLAPRLAGAEVVLAPYMPSTAMAAYAPGVGPLEALPVQGIGSVEWTVMPRLMGVTRLDWAGFGAAVRRAVAGGRPVWVVGRQEEGAWLTEHLVGLPAAAERVKGEPGYALRWGE